MLLLKRLPQILMVMLMMSAHTHGHTVCSAVSTARETTVTCLFGTDISHHGFSVHVFATPQSDARMLLACNRQSSGGLICDKRKDVNFDENQKVINQLTLTRPPSNHTLGVRYLCETVPSVEDHVQRCNLIFIDTNMPTPSENERNNAQHSPMESFGWSLIAIIMIAINILIIVVTCIVLWTQKKRMRKWWTGPTGRLWPGAFDDFEDPEGIPTNASRDTNLEGSSATEEKKPLRELSKRIPSGLPSYFFNLGWKEGAKDMEKEHETILEQSQAPPSKGRERHSSSQQDGQGATSHKPPTQKQTGGQRPSTSSGSAPHDQMGDKLQFATQHFDYVPTTGPGKVKEKQTSQVTSKSATAGQRKETQIDESFHIVPESAVKDPSVKDGAYAENTDGEETRMLTEASDQKDEETHRGKPKNGKQQKGWSRPHLPNFLKGSQKDKPKKETPQKTKQEPKENRENTQIQEEEM